MGEVRHWKKQSRQRKAEEKGGHKEHWAGKVPLCKPKWNLLKRKGTEIKNSETFIYCPNTISCLDNKPPPENQSHPAWFPESAWTEWMLQAADTMKHRMVFFLLLTLTSSGQEIPGRKGQPFNRTGWGKKGLVMSVAAPKGMWRLIPDPQGSH